MVDDFEGRRGGKSRKNDDEGGEAWDVDVEMCE